MILSRKQLTYQIVARVGELGAVAVLILVVVLLSRQISAVRKEVAEERQTLEASLAGAVEQGVLQSELERRQHDVDRLTKMIARQEEMDNVIVLLEEEAKRYQVQITIPSLEREAAEKGKKEPIAKEGVSSRYEEVRIRIIAHGKATSLLNFWHAVENLPYLTGVVEFSLLGQDRSAVPGSAPQGPASGPPGTTEVAVVETPEATLELVALITVWSK